MIAFSSDLTGQLDSLSRFSNTKTNSNTETLVWSRATKYPGNLKLGNADKCQKLLFHFERYRWCSNMVHKQRLDDKKACS